MLIKLTKVRIPLLEIQYQLFGIFHYILHFSCSISTFDMEFVTTNSIKTTYRKFGNPDHPAIVLLHGNSSSSIIFEPQFVSVLQDYHLVAIDFYGHGNSALPKDIYFSSVQGLGEQVASVINALELKQFIIYGVSLGGHVAIELIPILKDLKGIMISGAPPLPKPFEVADYFKVDEALPLAFKGEVSKEEANLWGEVCIDDNNKLKGLIADLMISTQPAFRDNLAQTIAQEIGTDDEKMIIETTELPIAIIQGEMEDRINNEYVRSLPIKNLFNQQVHTIANSAHYPNLEAAQQFNEYLDAFAKHCFDSKL